MAALKRRVFRSNIILEIDFFSTKDNPPAIHTLTKNYLDLLHKEMPHIDKLSKILFKDDSQIKILIANYHLPIHGNQTPRVHIKVYPLSDFIEDVELTERIIRNEFFDSKVFGYQPKNMNESFEDIEKFEAFSDLKRDLEEVLDRESSIISNFGSHTFELMRHFHTRKLQESYLKENKVTIADLSHIFQRQFPKNRNYIGDPRFEQVWDIVGNYISIGMDFLDVGGVPRKEGERRIFKAVLQEKLVSFKSKHATLFPLLQPIGLTIVFIPPEDSPADLDNLAIDLVPFIHEIFQPPVKLNHFLVRTVNPEIAQKEAHLLRELPKYSITACQLISVPRRKDDPPHGKINLIISDGMLPKSNVWATVDQFVNQWRKRQ